MQHLQYDRGVRPYPNWFEHPEAIPLLEIETLIRADFKTPILIVAPHPDDETLGCGGAIALLRQFELSVEVLIVSDGTKSHPNSIAYPAPALRRLRERESLAALKILGIKPQAVTFWGLPDGAISNTKSAIARCYSHLTNLKPATIFLPWRGDPHADHRASWQILTTACRHLALPPRIIEYPIWDWDDNQRGKLPDAVRVWRLNINKVLPLKTKAISQYRSQISDLIDDDPHGFRLTPQMLQNFTQPWEIYLELEL